MYTTEHHIMNQFAYSFEFQLADWIPMQLQRILTKLSSLSFSTASAACPSRCSRFCRHVILIVVHLERFRLRGRGNSRQLGGMAWRWVFKEVRMIESLRDENSLAARTSRIRRLIHTSFALIRLLGSKMRHLLRRSSAAGDAAVKSMFKGCFGNCPTEQ